MKLETRCLSLLLTSQQLLLQVNLFFLVFGLWGFSSLFSGSIVLISAAWDNSSLPFLLVPKATGFDLSSFLHIWPEGTRSPSGRYTVTAHWILAFLHLIFLILFICLVHALCINNDTTTMNVFMAVLPFLVNWHFPKFSVAAGSLSVPFSKGLFPETLQMFVASRLGVSLFTFYEKCWCLDLSLCLGFCIIPDLFFQKHHLGEQTWLRIIVYLFFLHYLIVKMFLLSSVKLVKLLSSNLVLMNYLLVLLWFSTFLSTFLIISKCFPNTAASSSTTSDLPECLPFPTFSDIVYF